MKVLLLPLFLAGLSQAVKVYLHPPPAVAPRLSASTAGAVLSRHFALERFEQIGDGRKPYRGEQDVIIGGGPQTALLVTVGEDLVKDVIPSTWKRTFTLTDTPSAESLSSLIPTYKERAEHVYSRVHSPCCLTGPEEEDLRGLAADLEALAQGAASLSDTFLALDLTPLRNFPELAPWLRDSLAAIAANPSVTFAVVTMPSDLSSSEDDEWQLVKRADAQPPQTPFPSPVPAPQEPKDSVSTCFTSAESCGNSTSSCSGHGECVKASKAGRTCFVCACSATKDKKGRRQSWAGTACERQDVSTPFVLLAGTVVTLLLLVVGSVTLLSSVGEDKLPSTLTGSPGGHSH